MKQQLLEELAQKLPEITQKFNEILAEHGMGHIVVQSANFSYRPCNPDGSCPRGCTPTPYFNPVTMQYDLCYCVPNSSAG